MSAGRPAGSRGLRGRLASALRRSAAAIALAASATTVAGARDVRTSLLESMTPVLAGSVGASADQLVRIREVLAHAEARFDRELAEAAVRVPDILAGSANDPDGDPGESMESRWRRAERAAARQRGRARSIESEAWAELESILAEPQRRRLARFVRLWERAQLGTPTLRIPPGWVDPIDVVHRVVRDAADAVDGGAVEGPLPDARSVARAIPALPPALRPHAGWLDEMDAAHLDRLARWRESRRESDRLAFALLDRQRALEFPAAIEADATERLLRREAELEVMRAGTVEVRLPALEALADFVTEFAAEAETRLPAPWGPRIAGEIHATAFGVLHDDPTSPLDAVAGMAEDEAIDEPARHDLAAAIAVAEAEHRVLTDALRRAERRRMSIGPRLIAGDETLRGEFDVLARRIGEVLVQRQAVHDALRARVRELAGPDVLARHPWPPPRDPRIRAWIVRGREAAERRRASGAG